jgi:hypothetical protein
MLRKSIVLICLAPLIVAGCARKAVMFTNSARVDEGSRRNYVLVSGGGGGVAQAASRYLAVRHKLTVVESEAALPKSLEAVTAFCGTIQCDVVSSTISSQTGDTVPSGSVSLRVEPGYVDKLLAFIGKQGKIAQHTTETEDKTAIVVDTDAKIKNLTDFRDNLRKMLARPAVSVKDLVEIEEKLAEVQAQLDSEAAQRKILANETEKVAVEIDFRGERTAGSGSWFRPIAEAARESASVLAESVASLITVIVAVIPWLILIVPGVWFLAKAWRRVRRKRANVTEPMA